MTQIKQLQVYGIPLSLPAGKQRENAFQATKSDKYKRRDDLKICLQSGAQHSHRIWHVMCENCRLKTGVHPASG